VELDGCFRCGEIDTDFIQFVNLGYLVNETSADLGSKHRMADVHHLLNLKLSFHTRDLFLLSRD
jgi:hypothetical protein